MNQDKQAVVDHIHSIFRAFLARDRDRIRDLHTEDWVGFQGPSQSIERGVDAYMVNVDKSLEHFHGTGYELLDTEVQLYGDCAIVYYVARYDYRSPEGDQGSIPLRSIDIYRKENGAWSQCGSHITPIPDTGNWGESGS